MNKEFFPQRPAAAPTIYAYELIGVESHNGLLKIGYTAGQIGNPIPARIIGIPTIAKPFDICTETFLRVGYFNSEEETKNVITYMKTKFFRLLVGIRKNKNMTQDTYSFVPLQDFSEPWTDEKLYKKYGLTQEEIDFIESMIRPMDLQTNEKEDG